MKSIVKTLNINFKNSFENSVILLEVLGSPTRCRLLKLLNSRDNYTLTELTNRMDCTMSNVSQQLHILEDAGLIEEIKVKGKRYKKIFRPFYDKVIVEFK